MRAIALAMLLAGSPAGAAELVAIYWEPPGHPTLGASVREAFAEAVKPAQLVDATPDMPIAPSLSPAIDAAKALYARFAFAEAIAKLDELQRLADARGGGDLDARRLSEIFFYRGLARLETGAVETAWEDLVRAARLDPARMVDPARFAPRAVNAYKRAAAEVAQAPRSELRIETPANAQIRVDGAAVAGPVAVTLGQHFVAVVAEGYEPWSGVVSVAGAQDRFVPPLRPFQPPDGDRLLALAPSAQRLLLGALERTPTGWRFLARDITLLDGKSVSESVTLGDAPARALVSALVRRLLPPPSAPPLPPARRSRWWIWAVAGAGAAVLAISIGVGVGVGSANPSGTVGGKL